MVTKDDNELVYEVIHGSISSFEILIDRYQKTVFNIMLRSTGDTETAKDLTQDVFVKAFENMGRFNFRYRFFSWLYRMAINEAINHSRKHHFVRTDGAMEPSASEEPGISSGTGRGKLIHKAIRSLADEYRTLVLLKYYCGLSYEEIAEVTSVPVKKVRSRLFTAREQLRTWLVRNDFFEND